MFHLAPVGLSRTSRVERSDHLNLEHNISVAVQDIVQNSNRQTIIYNHLHPDTKALIKTLDAFFSHGLNSRDKCYWCFVREFIPAIEQAELPRAWNCHKARSLSIAWLKESLNKSNLHMQMLAFLSSNSDRLKFKWYHKNACLCNRKILKKICNSIACLENVEFSIEAAYVFCTEDVPIALPIQILSSPQGSTISSPTGSHHIDVVARRPTSRFLSRSFVPGSLSSMTSFHDISSSSHLSELTENLVDVDLPLSASKLLLMTERDQNYIIDELVQSHRKRANGYFESKRDSMQNISSIRRDAHRLLTDDECTVAGAEKDDFDKNSESCSLIFNSEKDEVVSIDTGKDAGINSKPESNKKELLLEQEKLSRKSSESTPNTSSRPDSSSSRIEEGDSGLSDVEEERGFTMGVIPVDSGEIVHLAMEIFQGDGELFQKLFQVYTGHSAGQPLIRYMAVTDQSIYFFSYVNNSSPLNGDDGLETNFRVGSSSFTESAVDATLAALRKTTASSVAADHYMVKYIVHTSIALSEIDCITIGIDAQVFCIHLKKHKFLPAASHLNQNNSTQNLNRLQSIDRQNRRLFAVDTGCKHLTKLIVKTLCKTYSENCVFNKKNSSLPVFTHSTQLSLTINRHLKQELEAPDVEVDHHSLVYWIEVQPEDEKSSKNVVLEGYLNVRSVNSKSWMKRVSDWQYSYFVFMGIMLYQFSDSTCKFAQRAYNIREKITQVYEADLKNEEGFIFQLELDEYSEENGGCGELQFKCTTESEMKKWIENITLTLSSSADKSIPIACQLIFADSKVLFIQEGANCIVDGFMRTLGMLSIKDVSTVFVIRTEFHNALVIELEDGVLEWVFLRGERELRRLCKTFADKWKVLVEDNEDTSTKPQTFNRIYRQCTKMSNFGNFWLRNQTHPSNGV